MTGTHQGNAITVTSPNRLLKYTKDTSGSTTCWARVLPGNALSVKLLKSSFGAPFHSTGFYLLREKNVSAISCP